MGQARAPRRAAAGRADHRAGRDPRASPTPPRADSASSYGGATSITCIEHRDADIGPCCEGAIAIPLNELYFRANLPGRALMSAA